MEIIATDRAPAAIGPYSQAVKSGDFVFCSGQLGIDPVTGVLAGDDVKSQAAQVLRNVQAVLAAAGLALDRVVKTTIFLSDMDDFSAVNALYGEAFGAHRPARATVGVARLPLGARVEIECVAAMPR